MEYIDHKSNPVSLTEDNYMRQSLMTKSMKRSEHYSLDDLFSRIGFGLYNYRLIIIVGLVAFSEGAQIIVSTLCITILQNEWGFSDFTASVMTSTMFAGIVVGSGVSGKFADKFGRYYPLMISLALMSIFNVISAFSPNPAFFVFSRTLLGFFMGFFGPLGFTMVAENVPINYRGGIVMVATAMMFIGELWGCLLAFFTADNLNTGDWSMLILWSSSSILLALLLNFLFLDESLRYLCVAGQWDKAVPLCEKMMRMNSRDPTNRLTDEDKAGLKNWQQRLSEEITDADQASIGALFRHGYKSTTLIIWLGWLVNTFVYYGIVLFLPQMLEKLPDYTDNSSSIASITISVLIESISVVISMIVINSKSIGRKQFLVIFYVITAVVSFLGFFDLSETSVVAWATVTKISINVCSFYFYLYTVEVYPTKYRATGMGVAAAVGKLGAIAMPWVCYTLIGIEVLLPFIGWSVTCLLTALVVMGLPIDTKDKELK